MGHRNIFWVSQYSSMDNDRNWNHPPTDHRLHLENGPFLLPMENTSEANTFGSYAHPSSAGSSSRVSPNYVQHGPPYDQYTIRGGSSTGYPQLEYGRAPLKRKTPAFPVAFDSGCTSRYYSAGSSSNLHTVSSDHLWPKPMPGSQCWPRDPMNMVPSYRSNNLSTPIEGSQRNVRSRHSHSVYFEMNLSGSHPSLPVTGQWSYSHVPLDSCWIRSSGSGITTGSTEINGRYNNSNPIPTTNPRTPLSAPDGGLGCSTYGQRTSPYPSSRPMGFASTLQGRRQPELEVAAPVRYIRPLSIGHRSGRIERRRNIYESFHSDGDDARNRWVSEDVAAVMDRLTYDSWDMIDQHHDLRLDIDNMSYEELLALEERIGDVSTGLTASTLSKYLTETICCVFDRCEEGKCAICLEEYKDGATLGRLNCGHDFHGRCIKNWLQMKNICPICKAAAVEDPMEEN